MGFLNGLYSLKPPCLECRGIGMGFIHVVKDRCSGLDYGSNMAQIKYYSDREHGDCVLDVDFDSVILCERIFKLNRN